jgi:hypothetical protein
VQLLKLATQRYRRKDLRFEADQGLVRQDPPSSEIKGRPLDRPVLVRLSAPQTTYLQVIASRVELHGDHVVLLCSNGKLAALFLEENVDSLFFL